MLQTLESVAAGLSQKEVEEQSSCYAFKDGYVMTYNGELASWCKLKLDVEGAVPAAPLLAILGKYPDDEIDVSVHEGEFILKGKNKRTPIRMEAEVLLRIDEVERAQQWQPLDPNFCEGVSLVYQCASKDNDDTGFAMSCVNITPDFIEACDNLQLCRFPCANPVEGSTLVRRDAIKHVIGLDMTHVAQTKNWIHFRNPAKLVLSCRRYMDDYRDLSPVIEFTGQPLTLPGGLAEVVDRANVFSSENPENNTVEVALTRDMITIKGTGALGRHLERKRSSYEGKDIRFLISPAILTEVSKKSTVCAVTKNRLKIETEKFIYVSVLGAVLNEEE